MNSAASRIRALLRSALSRLPSREPPTAPVRNTDNEVYPGYDELDVARIATIRLHEPPAKAGMITDFLGIRTSPSILPYMAFKAGTVIGDLPLPDDALHADGIEYAALARVAEQMRPDQFVAFELGAGWGPWICAAGVVAQRKKVRSIKLLGIEADEGRFAMMREHLTENGLRPASDSPITTHNNVHCELICGAAWWQQTELYFPKIDSANDHGGAVADHVSDHDYRGMELPMHRVQALSVPELIQRHGLVDFIHVDIQGGEAELLPKSIDALDTGARFLFVGTHNRKIEGDLIELFMSRGWKLLNEKPCRFDPNLDRPTLTGMTTRDGAQFWQNAKFA